MKDTPSQYHSKLLTFVHQLISLVIREETFDWFRTFSDISDEIHRHVPDKTSRIVMLGCVSKPLKSLLLIVPSYVYIELQGNSSTLNWVACSLKYDG